MNSQNTQHTQTTEPVQPVQSTENVSSLQLASSPTASRPSNKRGKFWLIVPGSMVLIGFLLFVLNTFTPDLSSVHVLINVVSFLLIGPGLLAFIPGLIYGIYLINKK